MNEEPLDVRRFGRAIARGRWTVVTMILAGLVAGGLLTLLRVPRHSASAVVLLPAAPAAPAAAAGQPARDIQTEVELAKSSVVLELAADALPNHPSIDELKRDVRVAGPTPDVLVFKSSATSARDAIAEANAAANAFQSYSKTSANDLALQVIAPLTERVNTLVSTNADLQNEINQARSQQTRLDPRSPNFASLASQIALWQNQLVASQQELEADRNQIAAAAATTTQNNAIKVISPAAQASDAVLQKTGLNLFGGALVGLLLAATILIAKDSRKPRLPHRRAIAAPAGIPAVATLTAPSVGQPTAWFELLNKYEPKADEQWALRGLLRSILATGAAMPARATVVSIASDDFALAIAPLLASFGAASGLRTILVVSGTTHSASALRSVRQVTAVSGLVPRQNLSLVEDMPVNTNEGTPPVDLIVRIVVTDAAATDLDEGDGATMLFAVSAEAATTEQIQKVADAAAEANTPLAGIVIATPATDEISRTGPPRNDPATSPKQHGWSAS
jgi:capsular polysaccharide biosynthesis protein